MRMLKTSVTLLQAWLLPYPVERLHVGDLHAVGRGGWGSKSIGDPNR